MQLHNGDLGRALVQNGGALRAHLGLQEQLANGKGANDGAGLAARGGHAVQRGSELGVEHLDG